LSQEAIDSWRIRELQGISAHAVNSNKQDFLHAASFLARSNDFFSGGKVVGAGVSQEQNDTNKNEGKTYSHC
jgi:hypothetical protein